MAKRKSYTKEYKVEALEKWQSSGQSAAEIEREMDISRGSLSRWKRDLGAEIDAGKSPDVGEEEPKEPEVGASRREPEIVDEAIVEDEPTGSEYGGQGEEELEPEQVVEERLTAPSSEDTDSEPAETVVMEPADETGSEGPSLVKRIAGIAAVIFGVLGVILSIAAIVAVWIVNKPITDTSVEVLVTVEVALDVIEENLVKADETLQTVRDSISTVSAQLPAEELLAVVGNIKSVVDAAQSTADTASSVFGVANSIPFLGSSRSPEQSGGSELDELSSTLVQISTGLSRVEELLNALSEGGAPGGLIDNIDQDIDGLQTVLNEAEGNVNEAGTVVQELQLNVPRWIDAASIIITFLLIWLGVAQYSLLAHGWGWFRGV
jgi:transposase